MRHPTAIIDPAAQLADDVEIGAYAIIGSNVSLGEGCKVAPGAQLVGRVEAGSGCSFGNAAIIGADPQDLSFDPATDSGVRLGSGNTLREHVTVHRSASAGGWTTLGDDNFLMVGTHVGHDSQIGSNNVIANNCMIGGHVHVGSGTFLGGASGFHQFVHVGDLCMVQGNGSISKDVPPYCVAHLLNRLAGLNVVGLRRAGFDAELRSELKRAYKFAFRSGKPLSEALEELRKEPLKPETQRFLDALASPSRKGVCFPKQQNRPETATKALD
jgi:UDP-N-acetylglucosamine acyltransferase